VRPTGERDDPWAWLSDAANPDTIAYLEAENSHSAAWFDRHAATVGQINSEIVSRIVEDDIAHPVERHGWWYTAETRKGLSYPVHTRGRSAATATEHVLLDENVEAAGHDYLALGAFEVSNDDALLAWSSDHDGSEKYLLTIRNIATGVDLVDEIPDTSAAGVAWSADDRYLFYVTPDDAMRPWKVWRHLLGTPPSDDVCIFTEVDERFFVGVDATRSGDWIVIESGSRTSSETWLIDARAPEADIVCVRPRADDVEYSVDHWDDRFIVVTNLDAVDFRVMTAPLDAPGDWQEFIAHQPGARITGFDCFDGFAVMQRWERAQQVLSVIDRDGSASPVEISSEPHEVELEANPNWHTDGIRLVHQSLTVPRTVAWWSLAERTLTTLKQTQVPQTDLAQYVSERTWATADDGTLVPVDVVRRRDTPVDGTAPAVLYAYGAYEASMPPWFSVARLSLLDRGWVWALAHPRGGGEMGRQWYLDGKLLAKRNTFTDTIACARHLAALGMCDPGRLAVRGGSAGGLLVGACITIDPQLFRTAVAEVPFVDVVTTMSDPSLPLTVTEWEEWGDPRSEPHASYIESYSPYDNTGDGPYPDLYVTAGLNDPRVGFHEPAKWVAKIRHQSPSTFVVFKCEMGAGHGGPSGRYEQWRDEARTLAFLVSRT
jgi:oligopeptidase B